MMEISCKAIARAAGYTVVNLDTHFIWIDNVGMDKDYSKHLTEEDAYRVCCIDCGLIVGYEGK